MCVGGRSVKSKQGVYVMVPGATRHMFVFCHRLDCAYLRRHCRPELFDHIVVSIGIVAYPPMPYLTVNR